MRRRGRCEGGGGGVEAEVGVEWKRRWGWVGSGDVFERVEMRLSTDEDDGDEGVGVTMEDM